ncbi:hypothetical protein K1Y24_06095 [Mammaliicoccus sciuri]|uniref:hypothetical protein n=1 Tax=Mammaliicoccus sciuri TaxID=1296 RepID=UPI001E55A723|nr:hypothetical protein [Mammaliicoccus sciuri]MCD8801528.1 hypothetical protein [Mammaliicoccus sciuri]
MNSINLINYYNNFKKDVEERYSIPIHYVIFGILLIIRYFDIPVDKLISFLDEDFKYKILQTFSIVYNHLILWFIIILILMIIISIVFDNLNMNRFVPPDTEYTNGTKRSINYILAIRRLSNVYILIITKYWIYYFLALVLINKGEFIYLNEEAVFNNWSLMIVNIIILIFHILKSLFLLKISSDSVLFSISKEEIEKYYIILNEKNDYVIVKPIYREYTIYYIIKNDNRYRDIKHYKVINKSKNFDEIIYNFDYLTNNL